VTFRVAAWAVVFVLFEALIPFNVLGEPFRLVVVEMALQLVAMLLTGLTIALVYRGPLRDRHHESLSQLVVLTGRRHAGIVGACCRR